MVRDFVTVVPAGDGYLSERRYDVMIPAHEAAPDTFRASRIPLIDLVAHARVRREAVRPRGDLLTTATIYGAAVLATAGFVIASIIDELLGRAPRT